MIGQEQQASPFCHCLILKKYFACTNLKVMKAMTDTHPFKTGRYAEPTLLRLFMCTKTKFASHGWL